MEAKKKIHTHHNINHLTRNRRFSETEKTHENYILLFHKNSKNNRYKNNNNNDKSNVPALFLFFLFWMLDKVITLLLSSNGTSRKVHAHAHRRCFVKVICGKKYIKLSLNWRCFKCVSIVLSVMPLLFRTQNSNIIILTNLKIFPFSILLKFMLQSVDVVSI